jgi:hypothetical protein
MIGVAGFFGEGFGNKLLQYLLAGALPLLVFLAVFMIAMRFAGRGDKTRRKIEKMLALDEAANRTRVHEIDTGLFYEADFSALPVREYNDEEMARPHPCYLWQKKVLSIYGKKMLRFDRSYSNIELKHMFGVANLEFVARYEENFMNYIHALRHWAEALLAFGASSGDSVMADDARVILEIANDAGSEVSQTYTILADIYVSLGLAQELEGLRNTIINRNFPGKQIALDYINKL